MHRLCTNLAAPSHSLVLLVYGQESPGQCKSTKRTRALSSSCVQLGDEVNLHLFGSRDSGRERGTGDRDPGDEGTIGGDRDPGDEDKIGGDCDPGEECRSGAGIGKEGGMGGDCVREDKGEMGRARRDCGIAGGIGARRDRGIAGGIGASRDLGETGGARRDRGVEGRIGASCDRGETGGACRNCGVVGGYGASRDRGDEGRTGAGSDEGRTGAGRDGGHEADTDCIDGGVRCSYDNFLA